MPLYETLKGLGNIVTCRHPHWLQIVNTKEIA